MFKINQILTVLALLVGIIIISACSESVGKKYGKEFTPDSPMELKQVFQNKDQLLGKTIQVQGKVNRVCQTIGCWFFIQDKSTPQPIFIDIERNRHFSAKVSINDNIVVLGELKQDKRMPQPIIIARGVIVK